MSKTKIEWCDKVWNPVTGCTKVSSGCKNCYAERMSKRLRGRCGYPADEPFRVTLHEGRLEEPLHWRKPARVFVCSMGDLFHEDVPDSFIRSVFTEMALCRGRGHIFIVLTKRPEQMYKWVNKYLEFNHTVHEGCTGRLPSFVWLGVSVEDQATADERIPFLLQTPAAKRFVSYEPALGPVDFSITPWPSGWRSEHDVVTSGIHPLRFQRAGGVDCHIDWLIMGGESGPGARPMHPHWARAARNQCQAAGVPFFFKGWGEWAETQCKPAGDLGGDMRSDNVRIVRPNNIDTGGRFLRGDVFMRRVGKKLAGAVLDGREWQEVPE